MWYRNKNSTLTSSNQINLRRILSIDQSDKTIYKHNIAIMKTGNLLIVLLFIQFPLFAQNDSIKKTVGKAITNKFPTTRTFDVQYDQLGPANFNSELFDKDFENGKIQNHYRLKIATNILLYKKNRFFLTNSLRYKYETFDFGAVYNQIANTAVNRQKQDFHYFSESVSATYFSQLFKKPVIYNATATVDANKKSFQRVKGLVTATIILKKTQNTTMTAGLVGIVDPSAIIPFTPTFSYDHIFVSKWEIDFILPKHFLIRKPVSENGRVSFGTEMSSESFYLNLGGINLNENYEYNQLELHSGVIFDYQIYKNFISTFKAGMNNVMAARITERGKRTNDDIISVNQNPQFYGNLGLSYNLF